MKTSLTALAILGLIASASPAADPAKDQAAALHNAQVASFIARVAYAKENAAPVILGDKAGGTFSCTVYTVKQGAGGAPGYTAVIARNVRDEHAGDIVVLSDTVAVDPAHFIKCAGHAMAVQHGSLITGGEDLVIQLGLGKEDTVLKVTGAPKIEQM